MKTFLTFIENVSYKLSLLRSYNIDLYEFPNKSYECTKNTFSFSTVGLFIHRNFRIVVFPKCYSIPSEINQQITEASYVIKSIQKYNRKFKKQASLFQSSICNETIDDSYISSMLLIIENYLETGILYKESKKHEKNINRKIDWNKTLKSITPIAFSNSLLYLDTYSKVKTKDYSTPITELHKLALYESFEQVGFLFNIDYAKTKDLLSELEQSLDYNRQKYKYFLDKEISETYSDAQLELLGAIRCILFEYQSSMNKMDIVPLISYDFQLIWQDVVAECFGNNLSLYINDFPKLDISYNNKTEHRSQSPDTVYQNGPDSWCILDAKYYDVENNRPGKGDYLKQYFYEFSFTYSQNNITNALIFNTCHEKIEYLGQAKITNATNSYLKGRIIHMIGLNQYHAYKCYANNYNNQDSYRKLLDSTISAQI